MSDWLCHDGTYPLTLALPHCARDGHPWQQGKPEWEFHASTGAASVVWRRVSVLHILNQCFSTLFSLSSHLTPQEPL